MWKITPHYHLPYLVTELNNRISEIKISLHGLNSSMQMTGKKKSQWTWRRCNKNYWILIIEFFSKKQKLSNLWNIKRSNIQVISVLEKEKKLVKEKREKKLAENFSSMYGKRHRFIDSKSSVNAKENNLKKNHPKYTITKLL